MSQEPPAGSPALRKGSSGSWTQGPCRSCCREWVLLRPSSALASRPHVSPLRLFETSHAGRSPFAALLSPPPARQHQAQPRSGLPSSLCLAARSLHCGGLSSTQILPFPNPPSAPLTQPTTNIGASPHLRLPPTFLLRGDGAPTGPMVDGWLEGPGFAALWTVWSPFPLRASVSLCTVPSRLLCRQPGLIAELVQT